NRHGAHLAIAVWRDTNGRTRFDVIIHTTEFSFVRMKLDFVLISRPAQRLMSDAPGFAVSQVTDVTELTPAIARHIFAPAGDINPTPGAHSSPSGRNDDAILAV